MSKLASYMVTLLLLCTAGQTFAQTGPTPAPSNLPKAPKSKTKALPAQKPTVSQKNKVATKKQRHFPIQGEVHISLPKLNQLLSKRAAQAGPKVLPLQALYQGVLQKRQLLISAKLRVKTQKKGQLFTLGGQGGLLTQIVLNGQSAMAFRKSDGTYQLLLPKGEHTITYKYHLLVKRQRSAEQSIQLHFPRFPQAKMQLTFPDTGWAVHTRPQAHTVNKQINKDKKRSTFSLILPTTGRLKLFWKGSRIKRKEHTRFRARVESMVTLQEGLLLGKTHISARLLTGSIRSLTFKIPTNTEVLHVSGKGVVEWYQSNKDKLWRTITVQLSRAIRKHQSIHVRYERTKLSAARPVVLPRVLVPKAEQYNGLIGVLAPSDTEISHNSVKGAHQMDVRSLPSHVRKKSAHPILLAYNFHQENHEASVNVTKHPRVKVVSIIVNSARFETIRIRSGREVTKATYNMINNRRQFMLIDLPKGAKVTGTFVAGTPVQPAVSKERKAPQMSRGTENDIDRYLIPLVRSSGRKVGRVFQVEILYSHKSTQLESMGSISSHLPSTPIEVLSYTWSYYLPRTHRPIWFGGSVQPRWQRRFLRRLERRMIEDLKAGTPNVWASSRRKYKSYPKMNIYSKKGLKERFAAPAGAAATAPKFRRGRFPDLRQERSVYKSRFTKTQWQVRAELPLIGRKLTFKGHLLRGKAPDIKIWYIHKEWTNIWFWWVLLLSTFLTLIVFGSAFGAKGVQWKRIIISIVGLCGLFVLGYFIPMTYLAGFRGALFGFWFACLIRLGLTPKEDLRMPGLYIKLMRWWSVAWTFMILFSGHLGIQITALFFALPVYPALVRAPQQEAPEKETSDEEAPSEEPAEPAQEEDKEASSQADEKEAPTADKEDKGEA